MFSKLKPALEALVTWENGSEYTDESIFSQVDEIQAGVESFVCVCVHVYMFSKGKVFDNEQQMKVEMRRNKTNVNSIRHKIRWGLKGRAVYSEKSVRQELWETPLSKRKSLRCCTVREKAGR